MMNSVANDILEPLVGDFWQETGWLGYVGPTSTGFKASAMSSALCLTPAS